MTTTRYYADIRPTRLGWTASLVLASGRVEYDCGTYWRPTRTWARAAARRQARVDQAAAARRSRTTRADLP